MQFILRSLRIIRKLLTSRISTDRFDRSMGQMLFFTGSAIFLPLAVNLLGKIQLSEGDFVIGLFAAIGVSLLMLTIGLLLKPQEITR